MEISAEIQEGLQLAGSSARVQDKAFEPLLQKIFSDVSEPGRNEDGDGAVSAIEPAVLKESYASLYTLVLEAAKHDADNSSISSFLEDNKFSQDRIDAFLKHFQEKKQEIRSMLSNIGHTPPHIVDVDWRLDFYLKNKHIDKINQPTYLINLKTEQGHRGAKDIQFSCSLEQLQDLVGKLKDATKSLEKAAQGS
ncbi:COMM domain-containing protein 3-like isoform X1 [Strongylocentrotus purpuratus]|uniref:COMM domain-containing protein 3 n=1 Tax=Strongylocentrotus purpuratus TaxID=7668 RepID=A0A7M7P9P9_STRPU|nr:COMM domain-containing protein 3-like isoform X1 [Strongylocentrotus purpuratus]|eukprot:XP_788467.2 PREDICTED: COMM domain-containing protein 3 [Strongylocentrotus purpuratus]